VDRKKRRAFKIHRDYRGTPTLASRQFDMRDELFFVVFFHYYSCSTLIFPQQIFETCHFEWRWKCCGFLLWSRLVCASVTDICCSGNVRSTLLHTGCFPQRALSRDVNMRPVRFPLHLWSTAQVANGPYLSAFNTWSTTVGSRQWL
jgi:hypothetical protein